MEKFWTNFEKYFLPHKIKNLKFWKNLLEFCGKWKFFLKSVKKMTIFGKSLKTGKIWTNF